MEDLCENCSTITYRAVKLQLVKARELDTCGSLVLSNSVRYTDATQRTWKAITFVSRPAHAMVESLSKSLAIINHRSGSGS